MFVSIIAGVVLMLCGLLGLGKVATKVPASIVVGFTVGIAVAIALTNAATRSGSTALTAALRAQARLHRDASRAVQLVGARARACSRSS